MLTIACSFLFFFLFCRLPPRSTLFPYTTLFRSWWRSCGIEAPGPWVGIPILTVPGRRSEEHTSELQSHSDLVCRLLLEKKKIVRYHTSASKKIVSSNRSRSLKQVSIQFRLNHLL